MGEIEALGLKDTILWSVLGEMLGKLLDSSINSLLLGVGGCLCK